MVLRLSLICTLFFVLMGCQSNTAELKQPNPIINANTGDNSESDLLIKTIYDYYNLERNEMWAKAYDYRTPLFRKTVTKDFYLKQMNDDNEGWHLVRFEIVNLSIENDRASAKIKFTEVSPRKVFFHKYNITSEEDTK